MQKVKTRFPPSPTGDLHLGGARTALFNWLYARHTGGTFVFRLEDTDVKRSTAQAEKSILDAMEWLGIDWDEGPYYQSRRMDVYRAYVEKLLDTGAAYYCTCTPETLEKKREEALARNAKPKYDGTCRDLGLKRTPDAVVRLRSPLTGVTVFDDVVKGPISVANEELDDLVIQRSDGTPTYHLAVVVDDVTMGITHVIRGDDHVSNTPRQISIYRALGEPLPVYAHVPMVLGPDKKRLSKRHGATSVMEYKDMGILPEALINFLARLGWSHGDQEFFTRRDLIEKFSLENIGRAAGVFDMGRLLDLDGDHIKAARAKDLAPLLVPFLDKLGVQAGPDDFLDQVVETLKIRSKTLEEMARGALFYFQDTIAYEESAARKFLNAGALEPVKMLREKLQDLNVADEQAVEAAFNAVADSFSLKLGKIAQPVRVALTGGTASPGIFEIVRILGKEKVLSRLDAAIRAMGGP